MGSAFVKVDCDGVLERFSNDRSIISVGIGVEIVGRVVVVEFEVIGDDICCDSGCGGS